VKKFLFSVLATALLFAPAVGLSAEKAPAKAVDAEVQLKPVVVVSISGYDQLKNDIDFLGKLGGTPNVSKQLEGLLDFFTQGQGLAGLDKTKPIGAALLTDDSGLQFPVLGFIPVTDLKKLLDALSGLIGEAEDEGEGVYKIETDAAKVYLKERNGWAYLSNKLDALDNLPKDPLKILGTLSKDYDIAVRAFVQNVPESLRDFAMDQIKNGMQAGLQQGDDESDEDFALRKKVAEAQIGQIDAVMHELDKVTIGWNIDAQGSRSYFDIEVTAVANSKTAKGMVDAGKAPPSKLAGFLLPQAVATFHANSAMSEDDIEQVTAMLPTLQQALQQGIDKNDDLSDKDKEVAEEMLDDFMEILEASAEKGHTSAGLAIVGSGPFTTAFGITVAEGKKLEALVKKAFEFAATKAPQFPEVKYNVATHQGVTFQQLSIPVPDNGDDNAKNVKKVIGDPIVITLGFGPGHFLGAVGPAGIDTLKTVLTSSGQRSNDSSLPPAQLTVSLAPILKFASEQDDADPVTGLLAKSLKDGGKDHVTFTESIISNGVRFRLEAEEGVLRVIGMAGKLAQKRGGPGN
jgi:hypothetical protein